jgi:hypothetical protein
MNGTFLNCWLALMGFLVLRPDRRLCTDDVVSIHVHACVVDVVYRLINAFCYYIHFAWNLTAMTLTI